MVENLLGYLIGDVTNDAAVYVASSLMVENCHVPVGCLVSSQVCCIYIGQWPPNTVPESEKIVMSFLIMSRVFQGTELWKNIGAKIGREGLDPTFYK